MEALEVSEAVPLEDVPSRIHISGVVSEIRHKGLSRHTSSLWLELWVEGNHIDGL